MKTMLEDLLSKYPNIPITETGKPRGLCPYQLGYEEFDERRCAMACRKCWTRPLSKTYIKNCA